MEKQEQKMKLPKLDDLFTSQAQRDYENAEKVEEIDISKISNFPEHPFKVVNDDKMQEMVKSVKKYGVILPVIVRPKEDGTYEMISGHRRKRACELAGVKQIRCIVKKLTDESYLSEENQYVVLNIFEFDEATPSLSQAIRLKKLEQEGILTEEKIEEILGQEKPNQREFIKIHNERIEKYIPTKVKESGKVEDFIIQCVEEHNKREKLRQERNSR